MTLFALLLCLHGFARLSSSLEMIGRPPFLLSPPLSHLPGDKQQAGGAGCHIHGHIPASLPNRKRRGQEAPPDRLVGGARLHFIFHKIFAQAVLDFDPLSGLTDLEAEPAESRLRCLTKGGYPRGVTCQ